MVPLRSRVDTSTEPVGVLDPFGVSASDVTPDVVPDDAEERGSSTLGEMMIVSLSAGAVTPPCID